MRVGIPRETTQGERRVALVPETVGKLAAAGFELVVEQGAGAAASFPDNAYTDAGAVSGDPWDADGVVKVRKPRGSNCAAWSRAVLDGCSRGWWTGAIVRSPFGGRPASLRLVG